MMMDYNIISFIITSISVLLFFLIIGFFITSFINFKIIVVLVRQIENNTKKILENLKNDD